MYKNTSESRNPAYLGAFDLKEKQKEAVALQEEQDAEVMLFKYIIASACRSETPLSISRTMATYLGKSQFLPAGKVLAAVTPTEGNNDPMHNLMLLNAALSETPLELGETLHRDQSAESNPWISIHSPEMSVEDRINTLIQNTWREPVDPYLRHGNTPRPAPSTQGMRTFQIIALVILGVLIVAAAQTYGCVPDFLQKTPAPVAITPEEPAQRTSPLEPAMPEQAGAASQTVQGAPPQLVEHTGQPTPPAATPAHGTSPQRFPAQKRPAGNATDF